MNDDRSLTTLVADLAAQGGTLVRTEAKLLRAELTEKLGKVGTSAVEILGGAICLLAALMVLLQALVIALANLGLGGGWASLLVGVAVAALGLVLIRAGRASLELEEIQPEKTMNQVQQDARVLREQVK